MAMHVTRLVLVPVAVTGTVLNKNEATIQQMLTASSEIRVLPSPSIPNSAGYPTVEQYLIAEGDDGYNLLHIDQTLIITGTSPTVSLDATDLEIGAVEIKDSTTDDRAKVLDSAPAGTEFGVAVRQVGGLPAGSNTLGTVNIGSDVVSSFDHGAKSAIGTSAVQMTTTSMPATKGVLVQADKTNADGSIVYVGNSDVTAGTADATDGFQLTPDKGVTLAVTNANLIYVRGSTTGLRVSFLVI